MIKLALVKSLWAGTDMHWIGLVEKRSKRKQRADLIRSEQLREPERIPKHGIQILRTRSPRRPRIRC